MNMTLIAALISAGVAGLAGWGAAWTIQGRTIDSLRIEATNERIAIYRQSRVALERATGQIAAAQNDAKVRADRLAADLAAVGTERDRLRDSSAAAVRTATDSPATCASIVNAYNVIQLESSGFVEAVARDADQCLSNLKLMHDAWAKK